jgi:hypothetical protein
MGGAIMSTEKTFAQPEKQRQKEFARAGEKTPAGENAATPKTMSGEIMSARVVGKKDIGVGEKTTLRRARPGSKENASRRKRSNAENEGRGQTR